MAAQFPEELVVDIPGLKDGNAKALSADIGLGKHPALLPDERAHLVFVGLIALDPCPFGDILVKLMKLALVVDTRNEFPVVEPFVERCCAPTGQERLPLLGRQPVKLPDGIVVDIAFVADFRIDQVGHDTEEIASRLP